MNDNLSTPNIVIGLEVHVALATNTKMFCSCANEFGAKPNTNVCPICLGHPGSLPLINTRAVELAIVAGLITDCKINARSYFDRKNYFYPDLPKGYQITQNDLPLCSNGYIEISSQNDIDTDNRTSNTSSNCTNTTTNKKKRVSITRIHIEEDAGKLLHDNTSTNETLIDYNRCGVPLAEIVTAPEMSSSAEAVVFLRRLQRRMQFAGVSYCKMEQGEMRVDVNISLFYPESGMTTGRIEIKNLNSFKAIANAIDYEVERINSLEASERVFLPQTRRWDQAQHKTLLMRSKETTHDYRYFREPDLPPLVLSNELLDTIKNSLPELPEATVDRYVNTLGLALKDAEVLTSSKAISELFEATVISGANPESVKKWIVSDLFKILNERKQDLRELRLTAPALSKLTTMVDKGIISHNTGKEILEIMCNTGAMPDLIFEEGKWSRMMSESELFCLVNGVIEQNQGVVRDYKAGKRKVASYFVGTIMKKAEGRAEPSTIRSVVEELLNS